MFTAKVACSQASVLLSMSPQTDTCALEASIFQTIIYLDVTLFQQQNRGGIKTETKGLRLLNDNE